MRTSGKRKKLEDQKLERFLRLLVEVSALELLWDSWQGEGEDSFQWHTKMDILADLLEKKSLKRDLALEDLKEIFPELQQTGNLDLAH